MSRLYIIGNGFDLYHGVKSSYGDFDAYVARNFPCIYQRMGEYLSCKKDALWSDFEISLQDFKLYELARNNDFFRAYDPNELNIRLEEYGNDYLDVFASWVISLQTEFQTVEKKLPLEKDDYYITFNYTDYLESSYEIPSCKVVNINNKVNDNQRPCVGHTLSNEKYDDVACDLRVRLHNETDCPKEKIDDLTSNLTNFLRRMSKNPESQCLSTNVRGLLEQANISSVFVLGHSLSLVDREYFKIIRECMNADAKWYVSYYVQECYQNNEVYIQMKKKDTECSLKNLLQDKSVNCEAIQFIELEHIVGNKQEENL